jgi:hypothetical protein
MRTDANPMVYRWLVDTQEYDYTLEDNLGIDNPIADGFSRLVANNMPTNIITMLSPPGKIPDNLHVIIGKVHYSVSGHHGFERTLRILTTPSSVDSTVILVNPKTPSLRVHVKQYIVMCPCCHKMSMLKHAHFLTTRTHNNILLNIHIHLQHLVTTPWSV